MAGLDASSPLRIARPSRDLARAERFWTALGLSVLYRAAGDAEGDHALLMLGLPDAGWHLELVEDPDLRAAHPPSAEDLLVLYLGGPIAPELVERLRQAGGRTVSPRNPYWERWGVTFEDPDGYLLVLSTRNWP